MNQCSVQTISTSSTISSAPYYNPALCTFSSVAPQMSTVPISCQSPTAPMSDIGHASLFCILKPTICYLKNTSSCNLLASGDKDISDKGCLSPNRSDLSVNVMESEIMCSEINSANNLLPNVQVCTVAKDNNSSTICNAEPSTVILINHHSSASEGTVCTNDVDIFMCTCCHNNFSRKMCVLFKRCNYDFSSSVLVILLQRR